MLEQYYVRSKTVDRIRSSWIAESVEKYVEWLAARHYRRSSILRRIPIVVSFGEFAKKRGASQLAQLPEHVEPFVEAWVRERSGPQAGAAERKKIGDCTRNPIRQMLRIVLPDYVGKRRACKADNPFEACAPKFFEYLKEEKGLRDSSIHHYRHYLRQFAAYLEKVDLKDISRLSAPLLSGFVTEYKRGVVWSGLRDGCGVVRVFLRYLYREGVLKRDLSNAVEYPQKFRHSGIPRSIGWDQVQAVLESVDRREPIGKRDYAILLLLALYGLRAREIAALTLDDIDWRNDRLRIPERKAGHSTAYPLSAVVGEALVDYLKNGRPETKERRIFFRSQAPIVPIGGAAIASRCGHYLRKAGIQVPRPGSHTFRHSCVQRLVNADFSFKDIGDYVGHRDPGSTQIYGKVAVEALREVALGDGEEVLS